MHRQFIIIVTHKEENVKGRRATLMKLMEKPKYNQELFAFLLVVVLHFIKNHKSNVHFILYYIFFCV